MAACTCARCLLPRMIPYAKSARDKGSTDKLHNRTTQTPGTRVENPHREYFISIVLKETRPGTFKQSVSKTCESGSQSQQASFINAGCATAGLKPTSASYIETDFFARREFHVAENMDTRVCTGAGRLACWFFNSRYGVLASRRCQQDFPHFNRN